MKPTRITKLLGIELPVIQGGMSWASSNADLPAAVSASGGLGVIAAGPMYLDALRKAIQDVRARTDRPFAVNLPLSRKELEAAKQVLLDERVPVLIASQGGAQRYLDAFRRNGTICLHVVASLEHARKAAAAGVDGVIAVGGEAGGHPPPALVSTMILTRQIATALPALPLVAAGGIADGAAIAAVMALGADAAQLGTRFLMSEEAGIHPAYQQAVAASQAEDAVFFGREIGPIRALRNDLADQMLALEHSGAAIDERRQIFAASSLKQAALEGDTVRGKVEAGQTCGLIDTVLPVGTIIERLRADYDAACARLTSPSGAARAKAAHSQPERVAQ